MTEEELGIPDGCTARTWVPQDERRKFELPYGWCEWWNAEEKKMHAVMTIPDGYPLLIPSPRTTLVEL